MATKIANPVSGCRKAEVASYEAASGAPVSTTPLAGDSLQVALSPDHAAALTANGRLCGLVLGGFLLKALPIQCWREFNNALG